MAMMPGAEYGPAKRWPSDRFAELAARLAGEGIGVVVLGSAKERYLGEEIAGAGPARAQATSSSSTGLKPAASQLAST